jgi:hypothetical protein
LELAYMGDGGTIHYHDKDGFIMCVNFEQRACRQTEGLMTLINFFEFNS